MSRRMGLATALALTAIVAFVFLSGSAGRSLAGQSRPAAKTPVVITEFATAAGMPVSGTPAAMFAVSGQAPAAGPTGEVDGRHRDDDDDDDDDHPEVRRGSSRGHDDDRDDD